MTNKHYLTRAVEEFMKLDRGLTMFQVYAFLLVATNEGQTQKWVEGAMDTSNATTSRTLTKWMEFERPGKPGHGFVETYIDPSDRRYRVITLTPRGREFIKKIEGALN